MTTQESIDKFLTEKLFNLKWGYTEEGEIIADIYGDYPNLSTRTFHSPDGFFRLLRVVGNKMIKTKLAQLMADDQNPEQKAPRLVAEWLGWKENK